MSLLARSKIFSGRTLAATIGFALCIFAAQWSQAQNLTINFRFDGQSGAAATTRTIDAGTAGQSFTVDVWATLTGPAGTTGNQAGLVTLRFRGLSSTTANSAFSTGNGIGVTSFTMESPFNATANIPTMGDVGSASAYATTSATLDGLSDFGGIAATSAAVANSNTGTTPIFGGTSSPTSEPVTNGWEFMVGQFVIHTGTASTTNGATTSFLPVTGLGAAASKQSFTVDGGTTFLHGDWTSGTAVNFVVGGVPPNGTTIAVTPGPNASVLKGGIVGLAPSINNTGSTALAPGDYTFSASGGTAISYTAMPTVPIAAGGTANFSTTASTTAGPAGTPIGNATVTFTATGVGSAVSNSPQMGSLTLNVGGATAANNNTAGSFGPALTAPVTTSYAGLESAVVGVSGTGGSDATSPAVPGTPFAGGRAVILAGSSSAATTLSMAWRTRLNPSENPGTRPPLPAGTTTGLSSNVVDVNGVNPGDVFVMDMSYNPAYLPKGGAPGIEQGLANNKLLYMVSSSGADGTPYVNTVSLNTGNVVTSPLDSRYGYKGSYAAFQADPLGGNGGTPGSELGAWGVDIGGHEVWAVVNHNSTFAVVPEPATILLAGLGLLGIVAARRRIKK